MTFPSLTLHALPPGMAQPNALPPKARLATYGDRTKAALMKYPQAVSTAAYALANGRATDHRLARLDDAAKTAGIAMIAGFSALTFRRAWTDFPMWLGAGLGAVTWLLGMAIPRWFIHNAVALKTGIHPNTQYIDSNGNLRRLDDPGYLPLQVWSLEKRQKLAKRQGIPLNNPDWEMLFQEKVRKIVVQTHTIWMLAAGFATPVLSALGCHLIEDKAKNWAVNRRVNQALAALEQVEQTGNNEQIQKAAQTLIDAVMGEGTEMTQRARWWGGLRKSLLKPLGIRPRDVLNTKTLDLPEAPFAQTLVSRLQDTGVRKAFQETLTAEARILDTMLDRLNNKLLELQNRGKLDQEFYHTRTKELEHVRLSAKATLKQLYHVSDIAAGQDALRQLRVKLSQTSLGTLQQLAEIDLPLAQQLAGSREALDAILSDAKCNPMKAFQTIGKPPYEFFKDAFKETFLQQRWLRRYPGYLGGGTLLATVAYIAFFLGYPRGVEEAPASGGRTA